MFGDLLDEAKGFKYQITVKIFLKNAMARKLNLFPVYFNSTTRTVTNQKFDLDKSIQEILHRTDSCINEESGRIVESIESQYINISTFRPLIWSSRTKLPVKLKSRKKLLNVKNSDQKCFLWCHIRHINQVKIHPERITQKDKELVNDLNYEVIKFPVLQNDFSKIEMKNNICINVFCYENTLTYPIHIADQRFKGFIIWYDHKSLRVHQRFWQIYV